MTDYWKKAELKSRTALLDKSIDELDSLTSTIYIQVAEKLMNELLRVYAIILAEHDEPLLSHLYSYNKYYDMLKKVQAELTKLGKEEEKSLTTKMTDLYVDNQKIIGEEFGLSTSINKKKAEEAIKEIWVDDGKRFSDRIWKSKAMLSSKLQECLANAIIGGQSIDKLTEEIMKTFSVTYNEARRLIRTELAHASIKSTIDKYREAGILEYRIISEPDCCDNCTEEHVHTYSVYDENHLPPFHPFANAVY